MIKRDVIIACDFSSREATLEFLDRFPEGRKPFVKIGMELFYAEGPAIVRDIKARGHKIFLDLKLHDIPNTVKKAMRVLSALDVDMVNVHAAGTIGMMQAALEGLTRPDGTRPLLIAVTQLTSTSQEVMQGADRRLHQRHHRQIRAERPRGRPGRCRVLSPGSRYGQGSLWEGVPHHHPGHPFRRCRER